MSKNDGYVVIKFLEIRFADPISSLKLIDNKYVVTGTMMGRINFYNIEENKVINLSELNSENISDISYDDKEKNIYIGVGDEEIKVYSLNQISTETIPQNNSINVYESEMQHTDNCENAFILLSPKSLFRIQLPHIDEGTLKIITIDSDYDLKYFNDVEDFNKNKNIKTALPTTNYTVPFDFDGERFLWVEFLSSTQRNICVSNIPLLQVEKPYKYDLNKTIGHICQAKLLPNNRIFIVHSLNKCEIRAIDNKFTLLEQFEHIGEEVLGVDIYINEERDGGKIPNSNGMGAQETIFHKNRIINKRSINDIEEDKKESKKSKEDEINTNRILETSENPNKNKNGKEEKNGNDEYLYIKQNSKKEKIVEIEDICITTLDIDGNVNLFKNKRERTLFNLYDIKSISKDHKDKQFFSMGYAYYIKSNLNFILISSDHGCYVIKANDNSTV